MKATNKSALFNALNKFISARVLLIESVIAAGYPTVESARPDIMEWVVTRTPNVTLKAQGSGRLVFEGKGAASARNALRDVNNQLRGTTRRAKAAKSSSKIAVNKTLVKQVALLLKGVDAKALGATIAAVRAALK